MCFHKINYSNHTIPTLRLDSSDTETVNSSKLLGITFNSKLTWNTHIITSISTRLSCITASYMNFEILLDVHGK